MFVGKVIGTVWSTVKWPQVQGLKLLVVRPYHLADLANLGELGDRASASHPASASAAAAAAPAPFGGPDSEAVVCVDLLDAGVGDDVVVAFGHAARVAAQIQGGAEGRPQDSYRSASGHQSGGSATKGGYAKESSAASGPTETIVPIDAAVVAIVDSIRVARPLT